MHGRSPLRPAPSTLLALLLLGACLLQAGRTPLEVPLAEAALHEGQAPVKVAGVAGEVHGDDEGRMRLRLHGGGAALDVRAPKAALHDGQWAVAAGRIARLGGRLTLVVEADGGLAAAAAPEVATPSWRQVAEDPHAWEHRPIALSGTVSSGHLRDGDGHQVRLGEGPWPGKRAVRAQGSLAYDPACLCHRLHASRVEAWT